MSLLRVGTLSVLAFSLSFAFGCTKDDPAGQPGQTGGSGAASGEAPDYNKLPLGLDPIQRKGIDLTSDNPIDHDLVVLGKHLYFDTRLSKDGTISCATCHNPEKGWTDQLPV
ncbi:MAG TPA: cytochrome c peroxidase, partial [Planctomycetota bacterium]|nr:cytochrome c peroxidase [Planctomycetota bacterium]